jgi:hypothetical protein
MPRALPCLRLLPAAIVAGAMALAAVALVPSASAACVPRYIDQQDLACIEPVGYVTGTCLRYFVNPPAPGTSAGGYVCQPAVLCYDQPDGSCVRTFCAGSMCWRIVLDKGALGDLLG